MSYLRAAITILAVLMSVGAAWLFVGSVALAQAAPNLAVALEMAPRYGQAYHNRGLVRAALGDRQAAIEDLERAAALLLADGDLVNYRAVQADLEAIRP